MNEFVSIIPNFESKHLERVRRETIKFCAKQKQHSKAGSGKTKFLWNPRWKKAFGGADDYGKVL